MALFRLTRTYPLVSPEANTDQIYAERNLCVKHFFDESPSADVPVVDVVFVHGLEQYGGKLRADL